MKIKGIINAGNVDVRVNDDEGEVVENAIEILSGVAAVEDLQEIFILGEDGKVYTLQLGINLVEVSKEVYEGYSQECSFCDGYCYFDVDKKLVCLECGKNNKVEDD